MAVAGSMDDEALFGRTAYRLGHGDAVKRGIVSPLKLVMLRLSEAYERWADTIAEIAIDDEVGAARELVELCVAMLDCRERYGRGLVGGSGFGRPRRELPSEHHRVLGRAAQRGRAPATLG